MADSKITALTALTAADPANDMIPIVDVSDTPPASGNTKRISINNLLACSPSATLASATITGNLTVDTSTLVVDSALNNVGIGTASPNNNTNRSTLTINNGTWGGELDINVGATNHARFGTDNFDSGVSCRIQSIDGIILKTAGTGASSYLQLISSTGVTTWYDGAGGTRMTLNATGLGVGVASPAYKLDVLGSANVSSFLRIGTNAASSGDIRLPNNSLIVGRNAANSANLVMMQLDSSNALKLNEGSITIDGSANTIVYVTATAPTIANSNMVFNLTSNTNLRISVRGTDGTLRTANITLA